MPGEALWPTSMPAVPPILHLQTSWTTVISLNLHILDVPGQPEFRADTLPELVRRVIFFIY